MQRSVEEKEQAQQEKKDGEREEDEDEEEAGAWATSTRRLGMGPSYRDGKTRLGGFHGFECFSMCHAHLAGPWTLDLGSWNRQEGFATLGR